MKKFILSLLVFFFSASFLKAQVIDSMLKVYANEYPQQKVYVHFDKELYKAGETIWFKAYLANGFEPSTFSNSFYAELVDVNGNVVQRKMYPTVRASAAGSFLIPENAPSGKLRFRGYTTWMLNFDTSFFYHKDIVVAAKQGDVSLPNTIKDNSAVTLNFFPEGGDLVADIESNVAFKANNSQGVPVKVAGKISNQKGDTVATFTTTHNGMGTFALTPLENEVYTARWTDNDNKVYTTVLPSVKQQGIVLKVLSMPNRKTYVIKRRRDAPDNYKNLNVVAVFGQQVVYKAKVPLEYEMNSGFIPVTNFPSGVLQITIFSADWQPLAERIVMVQNNNYLVDATVEALSVDVKRRAKNTFEIQVPDTNLTNLSIAITDADINREDRKNNIISTLLLTGDLRGYVYNPAYYFSGTADSLSNHLDLVMLTHGWRRYNWSDLANRKKPTIKYPNDPYLSINAKVLGLTSITPIQPGEELMVILQGKDSTSQVLLLPKVGRDMFVAKGLMFYDTTKVYYQFNKDKKLSGRVAMQFDNGLYKGVPRISKDTLAFNLFSLDSNMVNRNKFFAGETIKYASIFKSGGNILQDVTVKTRTKSPLQVLDERYAKGLFSNTDGYSFDLLNDTRALSAMNIFTYLQSQVPGLTINDPFGSPSVSWRGSNTSLFLDEITVDPSTLATIPVTDIAYVKVIRPPFLGAIGGGGGGAIAVYTRRGGDTKPFMGKGLDVNTIVGYSVYKDFYSPDYSDKESVENTIPDFRTTLYWKPFIFLDGTRQKEKIEFYNNDISKAFKVVVEGMNDLGQLVKIEKIVK